MPTILITGAGRGLGLEFARQYAAEGWAVIATLRDPAKGAALTELGRSVEVHMLDVTDHPAIQRLARELKGRPLDLLLNNAGIYGPRTQGLGEIDYAAWEKVLATNVMGPLAMSEALADNIAASGRKLVVMVSSQMGSIGDNTSGDDYIYRSSKAALNAVTKSLSIDLGRRGIVVVAVHPGWVRTDMGGTGASLAPKTSIAQLRALFAKLGPKDSGKFFNYDGTKRAW